MTDDGRIITSTLAAVAGLRARGSLVRDIQSVLCVDTAVGISLSLVTVRPDEATELLSIGLAPDPAESGAARAARWSRALRMVAGRASSAESIPLPVTAVFVLVAGDQADVALVRHGLAHAPFWLPVEPVLVDRDGLVAEGACRAARAMGQASSSLDTMVQPCASRAIGVRVELPDGDEGVRVVIPAGRRLPTRLTTRFVPSVSRSAVGPGVGLEWVEIEPLDVFAEGGGGPRPSVASLCRATAVADVSVTAVGGGAVCEVEIELDADGILHLLPTDSWVIDDDGEASIDVGSDGDPFLHRAVTPDRDAEAAPGAQEVASPVPGLDDALLEEVARSETPRLDLGDALMRCEHLLSEELGCRVAIRSVSDLLGLTDDADVAARRTAARRLEAAMAPRGLDDPVAEAVLAAVRAARRTFGVPSAPTCTGGTPAALEDELRRTVEHLLLIVGELSAPERRRIIDDARRSGLSGEAVRRVLAGDSRVAVADDEVSQSSAFVVVDADSGRCALTSVLPAASTRVVHLAVWLDQPALV